MKPRGRCSGTFQLVHIILEAGDKPDRMQSQEKHNPIYYAQVKTDYESTW